MDQRVKYVDNFQVSKVFMCTFNINFRTVNKQKCFLGKKKFLLSKQNIIYPEGAWWWHSIGLEKSKEFDHHTRYRVVSFCNTL